MGNIEQNGGGGGGGGETVTSRKLIGFYNESLQSIYIRRGPFYYKNRIYIIKLKRSHNGFSSWRDTFLTSLEFKIQTLFFVPSKTNTMYSSNAIGHFHEESPSLAPTAPPCPQPPPWPPPPLASRLANTTTSNNAIASAPKPWSTGLCDCCDDVSSCNILSLLGLV